MSTALRVEVDGVEISLDQFTRSHVWKTAGDKVKPSGAVDPSLTRRTQVSQGGAKATTDVSSQATDLGGATRHDLRHRTQKRSNKGKRLKCAANNITMRRRGGLRVGEVSRPEVSRAITTAAQGSAIEGRDDVLCLNNQQKIIIVSTPVRERADKYADVECIDIRGTSDAPVENADARRRTPKPLALTVPLPRPDTIIGRPHGWQQPPLGDDRKRSRLGRKTESFTFEVLGKLQVTGRFKVSGQIESSIHRTTRNSCREKGGLDERVNRRSSNER
ncbi:hypothetical protein HPB48_008531 [Haemaphysalis longicornis]|uniref:Uncharacterized protein n=1 Tax=Haemaphysalis longicornis TaxID=44386 RepID=A0A9J6H5I3_HAELO|nr:hypothetical protein HPB48_020471 [Haemaphysalis longicornis]KAH9382055.1 hypothetical protein HPB48_008531 [Haemaphysalis longicornis]